MRLAVFTYFASSAVIWAPLPRRESRITWQVVDASTLGKECHVTANNSHSYADEPCELAMQIFNNISNDNPLDCIVEIHRIQNI